MRVDPFDLIFRRLTFIGELGIIGPLSVEVVPSWIWGSPTEDIDEQGFSIGANAVFYFMGEMLRGFWLKAHFGYEIYEATLSREDDPYFAGATATEDISTVILGGMIGSSTVFGRDGGFTISGGIGIGAALAEKKRLAISSTDGKLTLEHTYFDKAGRIQLLGSFSLGIAF